MMRRFVLVRHRDISGVSGTGVVAEGVVFSTGTTVLQWITNGIHSVAVHQSVEDVIRVHGHDGATTLRWIDRPEETAFSSLPNS